MSGNRTYHCLGVGPASPVQRTKKKPDAAIRGLTDNQITGMIQVLSNHLNDYVNEWNRRLDGRY